MTSLGLSGFFKVVDDQSKLRIIACVNSISANLRFFFIINCMLDKSVKKKLSFSERYINHYEYNF